MKYALRSAIFRLLMQSSDTLHLKRSDISVLCYHAIGDDGWHYSVSKGAFISQMEYLSRTYRFITGSDVERYIAGHHQINTPSILLTFDDGYRDVLEIVPFLRSLEIRPIMFVLGNPHSPDRTEMGNDRTLLSLDEIRYLMKNGWDIGSHGMNHIDFAHASDSALKEEIVGSKTILEKELGTEIRYFAYPKGAYTQKAKSLVELAGYGLGFSMDDNPIVPRCDTSVVSRTGINRTHRLEEYKALTSPLVVNLRNYIKKTSIASLFS